MDTCKVKLTISRSGPVLDQKPGDEVEVSLLEAGRLLSQDGIERPTAKILKEIASAEAAAGIETASAEAPETAPEAPKGSQGDGGENAAAAE